jgi:hypothetical protein
MTRPSGQVVKKHCSEKSHYRLPSPGPLPSALDSKRPSLTWTACIKGDVALAVLRVI